MGVDKVPQNQEGVEVPSEPVGSQKGNRFGRLFSKKNKTKETPVPKEAERSGNSTKSHHFSSTFASIGKRIKDFFSKKSELEICLEDRSPPSSETLLKVIGNKRLNAELMVDKKRKKRKFTDQLYLDLSYCTIHDLATAVKGVHKFKALDRLWDITDFCSANRSQAEKEVQRTKLLTVLADPLFTAPLTMAEVRAMRKVSKIIDHAEQGAECAFFKMATESKEILETFSSLLTLFPAYASGDVLFTDESLLWRYQGGKGPSFSQMKEKEKISWRKLVSTFYKNPMEIRAFFIGKNQHAGLVFEKQGDVCQIEVIAKVEQSPLTIQNALCSTGYRLKFFNMLSPENKQKMQGESKEEDVEKELQTLYHRLLLKCIDENKRSIKFSVLKSVRAFLKRKTTLKEGTGESIESLPEDSKGMICSEFVARMQDFVFQQMNEQYKGIGKGTQPIFSTLVASEKDYSLIYPARLVELFEKKGYEKLKPPLAVRLLVNDWESKEI